MTAEVVVASKEVKSIIQSVDGELKGEAAKAIRAKVKATLVDRAKAKAALDAIDDNLVAMLEGYETETAVRSYLASL